MANLKVSEESAASALAGTELVRIVQGGNSLRTTTSAFATLAGSTGSSVVPNAQTGTSYTVLTGDRSKLVTHTNGSAIAVTLPQAGVSFPSGWFYYTENRGAGTVTITPTTSTIDGAASVTLATDQGILIASDGTNYFTVRGRVAAGVYQPLDSDLTTIAALTATTDSFMQAKASAWATRTPTQVRTDLLPYVVVTVTYAGTTTVDLSTYASYAIVILDLTLTGDVTFNLTNGTDAQVIKLRVRQDGSGNHIWTSGANLRLSADITVITLSTAASKLDYIGFEWNGTNGKADVLAINKGF